MKRCIVLFFCMTHCATAMGQGCLIALFKCCTSLFKCCTCVQNPQRNGIQIDAKLYKNGEQTPISSDSRFYYQDASNDFVPAYDPIEMTHINAENRITINIPTINQSTKSACITVTARIGQGATARIEKKSVSVDIGSKTEATFDNNNLHAIITASKTARNLR